MGERRRACGAQALRRAAWMGLSLTVLVACPPTASSTRPPVEEATAPLMSPVAQRNAPTAAPTSPPTPADLPPSLARGDECGELDEAGAPAVACIDAAARRLLHPRFMFEIDKPDLRLESLPVLDQVAEIMAAHPEITTLEVAGHHASDTEQHY